MFVSEERVHETNETEKKSRYELVKFDLVDSAVDSVLFANLAKHSEWFTRLSGMASAIFTAAFYFCQTKVKTSLKGIVTSLEHRRSTFVAE